MFFVVCNDLDLGPDSTKYIEHTVVVPLEGSVPYTDLYTISAYCIDKHNQDFPMHGMRVYHLRGITEHPFKKEKVHHK